MHSGMVYLFYFVISQLIINIKVLFKCCAKKRHICFYTGHSFSARLKTQLTKKWHHIFKFFPNKNKANLFKVKINTYSFNYFCFYILKCNCKRKLLDSNNYLTAIIHGSLRSFMQMYIIQVIMKKRSNKVHYWYDLFSCNIAEPVKIIISSCLLLICNNVFLIILTVSLSVGMYPVGDENWYNLWCLNIFCTILFISNYNIR